MSVIDQHIARRPSQSAEFTPAGIRLAWDVLPDSPAVGRLAGVTPARARLAFDFEQSHAQVFLEVWTRSDQASPERRPLGLKAPLTTTAGASDLLHVDVPGLLRATIALADDSIRVLYARTPLLLSLGFPGGSYDRPVATRSRPG